MPPLVLHSAFLAVISLQLCVAKYPISGSWFADRYSVDEVRSAFKSFQNIGGSTVLQRGPTFQNLTVDQIKADGLFSQCRIGEAHCLDHVKSNLTASGLQVQFTSIWNTTENLTALVLTCPQWDRIISTEKYLFYQLTLSVEQSRDGDDCSYKNGSIVGIVLTAFARSQPDPKSLIVSEATQMGLVVYLGIPEAPKISVDGTSANLMQQIFFLTFRLMKVHKEKYSNQTMLKGYYSDAELMPSELMTDPDGVNSTANLPPRFVVLYWREIMFLSYFNGRTIIVAPTLDLQRTKNTSIDLHIQGLQGVMLFVQTAGIFIRDGRGSGRSAYFSEKEGNASIYEVEPTLWEILNQKNKSISKQTTYNQVYYNSTQQFFDGLNDGGFADAGIWLMVEAWNEIESKEPCEPVDPYGVGMGRPVERIHKPQLEQALSAVGQKVKSISAFAWDPLFLCHTEGTKSLLEELEAQPEPVITECRFHSQQNQSIVLIGFNMDVNMYEGFQVNYTLYDGTNKSSHIYGYYFELDYGVQHDLEPHLEYVMLFDIPNLKDLQRKGTITIRASNDQPPCAFEYELHQISENIEADEDVFGW